MNSVMKSESATKEAQALKQLLCLSPPLRALGKFVTANNESFAPKKKNQRQSLPDRKERKRNAEEETRNSPCEALRGSQKAPGLTKRGN